LNALSQDFCGTDLSAANGASSPSNQKVAGLDFFSGVSALQERMAQRKLDCQVQHAIPFAQTHAASPVAQPEKIAADESSGHTVEGDAAGATETPHPNSQGSCASTKPRRVLPQAEGALAGSVDMNVLLCSDTDFGSVDSEAVPEEAQADSDELLRWAEEVLRKAHSQTDAWEQDDSCPAPRQQAPAAPSDNCAPSHWQQQAAKCRDEVHRLQQESERDWERFTSEAASWRQRFVQEAGTSGVFAGWRDRISSAAEELRSNLSSGPFDDDSGQQQKDPRRHPRATSMPAKQAAAVPPSQRPSPPPGAPPGSRKFRKAFYTTSARSTAADVWWLKLEAQMEAGGSQSIHFADIPWPDAHSSLTGIEQGDAMTTKKQKLANALRRWHPDKWRRILDCVPEVEKERVMERVKNMAQRLLEEKAKLTGPGGALH
jgi:hypothetical protein